MAKFTVYYVGRDSNKTEAGPFMSREKADMRRHTSEDAIYQLDVDVEDRHIATVIPGLDGWAQTTGIKDAADLRASYDEFIKHWRATDANFDGWWKANKSRFLVDYDASIAALREMMAK